MTQEQLDKRIKSITRDAERLEETVRAMDTVDIERFPDEYVTCQEEAQRRAEWLACRLRHLLYETTSIRKYKYLLWAAEEMGIKFCEQDGIFKITLPGIAPGNSKKRPSEFLYDPLFFSLEAYCKEHRFSRYRRHCVVSFILTYDQETFKGVIPDADNLELKLYLDAAAAYLLVDDSMKYIDVYHSVELGNRHTVEMYFMERDRFPRWLQEREDHKEIEG